MGKGHRKPSGFGQEEYMKLLFSAINTSTDFENKSRMRHITENL
jgi:hypothetical protein